MSKDGMEPLNRGMCVLLYLLFNLVPVVNKCLECLDAAVETLKLARMRLNDDVSYPTRYKSDLSSAWIFLRSAGPSLPIEKSKSMRPI